jgi:alkylhydroperoxidase family enzyme
MTGDELRARAPHVLRVYEETRRTVLEDGIVERELKDLCARGLAGEDVDVKNERQRAALDWVDAIAWDSDRADDALWARLHAHFTEPELVELGYSIAIVLGQQHWLATHRVAERP